MVIYTSTCERVDNNTDEATYIWLEDTILGQKRTEKHGNKRQNTRSTMALAAPKVSLHLYLNNPYGLLSATIPNYEIHTPDKLPNTSQSPNGTPDRIPSYSSSPGGGTSPTKYQIPLPGILEAPEINGTRREERLECESPYKVQKLRFKKDQKDTKSVKSSRKYGISPWKDGNEKEVPSDHESYVTPRSKSTSGQSSDTNYSGESSPRLGFTWSINVDKERRHRKLQPPRPPPKNILEKLIGHHRNIEPVGIVKIKRPNYKQSHVSSYQIQKLPLADKGQRRVSEKLSEWLDQYNEVSLKQQAYLKKVHTLRRSLQITDDKRVAGTLERMRGTGVSGQREEPESTKHRRRYPVYTLTRLEDSVINDGPSHFPSRPLIIHTDDKHQKQPNIKLVPNPAPRNLAPIVKKIKTPRGTTSFGGVGSTPPSNNVSPRPEMMKMTTEYEPFESIARRNRLNLHQFLNPSIAIGQKSVGNRMPVAMATVKIISAVADTHSDVTCSPSSVDNSSNHTSFRKSKVLEHRPD